MIPERVSSDTSPEGVYSGLRSDALAMTAARRIELELPATPEAPVWGVLMEFGYSGAAATLFVLADGHTSLYHSGGGGMLGGGFHENVRQFAGPFLEMANRCRAHMTATKSFPVPEVGHTIFYALTDSGVLIGGGLTEDLRGDRHPLSELYHAGHEVLTQLRYMEWRSPALSMLSEHTGTSSLSQGSIVHGVLRETGIGAAVTMSILALIDGRAGVWAGPGGSLFDAQQLPKNLTRANAQFVEAANGVVRHLHPTEARPVPGEGCTTFYVGTQAGILSGTALTEELEADRHPLSPLYRAGEEVVAQGRLASQGARPGRTRRKQRGRDSIPEE
jgi:hypothetical protein